MKYLVGTMIEIPRAALTADEIAKEADFFSFGTNDLTQMTFGFSRDDAGKFLGAYYDKKIYENDPFAKLDQKGVGKLVEMACKLGRRRQSRPASGHLRRARRRSLLRGVLPPASAWTMCPALPSVCPSPVWPPLRLLSRRCNSPARASSNRIPASLRSMTGGLFFPPWHVKLKGKQR